MHATTQALVLAADDYYGRNPTDAFVFVVIVVGLYLWVRHKLKNRK